MPKGNPGVPHPPGCGHCAAIRGKGNPNIGARSQTAVVRAKMSAAWTADRRQRYADGQRGEANPMAAPQVRAKIAATLKGRTITPEWRAAISRGSRGRPKSEAHKRAIAEGHARSTAVQRTCGTWPEQAMAALLERAGVDFEGQKVIGHKLVDFYLPESGAVVEVDGVHWHPNGPDAQRDDYLREWGVTFVHHVTDRALGGWR